MHVESSKTFDFSLGFPRQGRYLQQGRVACPQSKTDAMQQVEQGLVVALATPDPPPSSPLLVLWSVATPPSPSHTPTTTCTHSLTLSHTLLCWC